MAIVAVGAFVVIQDRAIAQVDRSLERAAERELDELAEPDIDAGSFTEPPDPSGETPPGTALEVEVEIGTLPVRGPETVELAGQRFRTLVRALPPGVGEEGQTAAFYRSLEDVEATVRITGLALAIAAALASLLAITFVLTIVRRALRPLADAHAAAERVADSGDLSIRIPVRRPDEVGLMARTMNTMLSRLQGTQARLTRTLDEQRRFAADASHELRTPLTALRGDLEFLQAHDPPVEERDAVLDEMTEATKRMGRMAEGLLSLARLDAGAHAQSKVIDIPEVLRSIIEPGERLELPAEVDDLHVVGDPDSMYGIFSNLIENARMYGGDLTVGLTYDAERIRVVVSDDGPGIPPEDRERVFDRFFRGRDVRSVPGGAGLGLAIAQRAAEGAEGSLTLLPTDAGTAFEVLLPRQDAQG
ncbi:MAG: HAMP domain-containing histidine kinase [Thermoleophilia bacterium]|nr:HAMP domain-containing histidine kinase [Thermoleophilia bacterium]MDH3724764.1 HAMP domain-containing histidine kinase [Thermoleophilia bacterium]